MVHKRQVKNNPHPKREKLEIKTSITLLKVTAQLGVAMMGGATGPIVTKILEKYQSSNVEKGKNTEIVQPPGIGDTNNPLCKYTVRVTNKNGEVIIQQFEGYDIHLCNKIAAPIIEYSVRQEFPLIKDLEIRPIGNSNIDNIPDNILYKPFVTQFITGVPIPTSPEIKIQIGDEPQFVILEKGNINQLVETLYPNIKEEFREKWKAVLLANIDNISGVVIERSKDTSNTTIAPSFYVDIS